MINIVLELLLLGLNIAILYLVYKLAVKPVAAGGADKPDAPQTVTMFADDEGGFVMSDEMEWRIQEAKRRQSPGVDDIKD